MNRGARIGALAFGFLGYAVFGLTFAAMIGFMAGLRLPWRIDGPLRGSVAGSIAADLGLVALFGLQHSVMARGRFKVLWTRVVPRPVERTVYVLAACGALWLLFLTWRPIPAVVWDLSGSPARWAVWAIFWGAWAVTFWASSIIDQLELGGVRQVLQFARGRRDAPAFRLRGPYRIVRHPILLSYIVASWAVPRMTAGHAVFSAASMLYILVGMRLEERDLLRVHPEYGEYRRTVPALVPLPYRASREQRNCENT